MSSLRRSDRLFNTWILGSEPEPDPLDRMFKGANRRDAARARDFDALFSKLMKIEKAGRRKAKPRMRIQD
jgi:hypothetical protein